MRASNICFNRLLIIDREISRATYPSSKDLAKRCEVSIPTIKRDISDLKLFFHAPLEYSRKRNGYYYLRKSFRLPGILSSAENIKIASSICNFVEIVKGSPYYNDTLSFFKELSTVVPQFDMAGNRELDREKISDNIGKNVGTNIINNIDSNILFLGSPHTIINNNVWYSILNAIEKCKIISFEYKGFYNNESSLRVVYPYQLIFDDGDWSLFCYVPKIKDNRLFNLSKIEKIEEREERFSFSKDYDFRNQTEGVFGRYIEKKEEDYEILLKGYSAEYSRNRIFSVNQEIINTDNGNIIIKFHSNQYAPIKSWLLKQGANGIPLKPKRLVDDWKKEILEMSKNI